MKMQEYVIMFITMIIFLEFAGVPTGFSATLEQFGINWNENTHQLVSADLENSGFWDEIFSSSSGILILLVGVGAIVVGLFAKSYDTSLIILPFVIYIGGLFTLTSWTIIKYAQTLGQNWITLLVATIFIPLGIGFILSCVDYFAGR